VMGVLTLDATFFSNMAHAVGPIIRGRRAARRCAFS
jgi:hypothetical protein